MSSERTADSLDVALLRALIATPDATNTALAGSAGMARNTVKARRARYHDEETLQSFERRIDPAFLGYPLRVYIITKVSQRKLERIGGALSALPEILEVQGLTGVTDLLVQVVARDADDLHRITGLIRGIDGVKRTDTGLVVRAVIGYRTAQLLRP